MKQGSRGAGDLFESRWPLIATLHFPPLPGAPRYAGNWRELRRRVCQDAEAYVAGGVDAVLLENFGDAPFFPGSVPPVTLTHFAALAVELRERIPLPLGINLLRNDASGALAIACAAGAQFIRVNVLCGARVTDQGLVQGTAHQVLRERAQFGSPQIQILADVQVKHSAALAPRGMEEEVGETFERGGADAIIVTGRATGAAVDPATLELARGAAGRRTVLIGSGVTDSNVMQLARFADGFIVGSFLKQGGDVQAPVDIDRVIHLQRTLERIRKGAAAG